MSWTDRSDFSYTHWDVNEPSENWDGRPEDCVSVRSTGFWNDEFCAEDEHGYMCAKSQYFSNCLDIAEPDRDPCGAGLSERECDELKCCYDPRATVQCYRPQPAKKTGSMTAGKAAGITAGVFIALIAVSVVYFMFLDK